MLYNLQRKKRLSTSNLSVLGLIHTHEILLLIYLLPKMPEVLQTHFNTILACEIITTEVENLAKKNEKVRIAKK